jgi:hypothetical protein
MRVHSAVIETSDPEAFMQTPHCDQRVLHAPGECEFCDEKPSWQAARKVWGIDFTGDHKDGNLPCPAQTKRSLDTIEKWEGNVATPFVPKRPFEFFNDYRTDHKADSPTDHKPNSPTSWGSIGGHSPLSPGESDQKNAGLANPKDLVGAKKPSLSKIPEIALVHESLAMMDGAGKYTPYNWRDYPVQASIYVDAAKRHLGQWFEREEEASDSGCHHLGHARACLGILLDAQETGNLIDDRPVGSRGVLARVYEKVTAKIPAMLERHAKQRK